MQLTPAEYLLYFTTIERRDGRVVEGAPLLREYGRNPIEGSNPSLSAKRYAPVAQLDRVSGYEPGGRRFESFRARHILVTQKILIRFSGSFAFVGTLSSKLPKPPVMPLDEIESSSCYNSVLEATICDTHLF